MASANPFDLLGEDDIEDPSVFLAAQEKKALAAAAAKPVAAVAVKPAAKLPAKPVPPTQAVREARNDTGRGSGGRGGWGGYGRGRGPGGPNRDFANNENSFSNDNGNSMGYKEEREKFVDRRGGGNGGPRAGRRGGFSNGDAADGERPRRVFERRSGTGRGSDLKRDGSGRGNWGTATEEIAPETELPVAENEETVTAEKPTVGEENVDTEKETPVNESEEKKEPEEKQMTLEEYEKVLEEKRKALVALKGEERKVKVDKELQSMQLVNKKNTEEEIFIKLGSDKEKRKEAAEKEERAKKSVSINEFLKPAEGETYFRGGGRGRGGRGRGRGAGFGERPPGSIPFKNVRAPKIEDPSQFPTLGAK